MDNLVGSEPALETELRTTLSRYDRRLEDPGGRRPRDPAPAGGAGLRGWGIDDRRRCPARPQDPGRHDGRDQARLPSLRPTATSSPRCRPINRSSRRTRRSRTPGTISPSPSWIWVGRTRPSRPTRPRSSSFRSSKRLSLRAALLLDQMGRLDEAFVYANIAIPYNPPAAHLLLAQIAFKQGDLEGAEMRGSRGDVEWQTGSRGRGWFWRILSLPEARPDQAIDLLTGTLEEGITDDLGAREARRSRYVWIGEFDRAEEVLGGFEDTDDLGLLLAFGRLALSRRAVGRGAWLVRARPAVDPTNPTVKLNLGVIAVAEGRLTEAEELPRGGALPRNPGSFEGWNTLGDGLRSREEMREGAIIAWERAHELNPGFIERHLQPRSRPRPGSGTCRRRSAISRTLPPVPSRDRIGSRRSKSCNGFGRRRPSSSPAPSPSGGPGFRSAIAAGWGLGARPEGLAPRRWRVPELFLLLGHLRVSVHRPRIRSRTRIRIRIRGLFPSTPGFWDAAGVPASPEQRGRAWED